MKKSGKWWIVSPFPVSIFNDLSGCGDGVQSIIEKHAFELCFAGTAGEVVFSKGAV
jgi:hypothetical protein